MKKIVALVIAVGVFSNTAFAASFVDIENHWAKDYIITLADSGVVNGVTDTLYMPDDNVTRAQYLKMIMETVGLEQKPVRVGECLDADLNDWYAGYLQSALDCGLVPKGMVQNYSEKVEYTVDDNGNATSSKVIYTGEFNGQAPITREEMAVLTEYMYQYTRTILTNPKDVEVKKTSFTDNEEISEWAKASIDRAVADGFIEGMEDNTFKPKDTATRAQAATVIVRVLEKTK